MKNVLTVKALRSLVVLTLIYDYVSTKKKRLLVEEGLNVTFLVSLSALSLVLSADIGLGSYRRHLRLFNQSHVTVFDICVVSACKSMIEYLRTSVWHTSKELSYSGNWPVMIVWAGVHLFAILSFGEYRATLSNRGLNEVAN